MASSLISLAPLVETMTGIDHDIFRLILRQFPGDWSGSELRKATMPVFYRIRPDICKNAVQLLCQKLRCHFHNICYFCGILCRQCRDALIAYTPFAIIVLMSAWIPAPPPESLPAIVSAVFIFICIPLSVSGEFAFIFYSQILSAFSRRSSAAFLISSQANRPLTTATPAIFLPFSKRMLPPSMPPIATTGIFTFSQISCKSA